MTTEVMSKKQVMEALDVSSSTLQRWEDAGQFPKRFHLGNGKWKKAYWKKEEFEQWLDRQTYF